MPEVPAWPAQEQSLAGTSSFGMSGVNAHALLEAPAQHAVTGSGQPAPGTLAWHRQRMWPAPPRMALLSTCTVARGAASFVLDLAAPAMAYLRNHQARPVPPRRALRCQEDSPTLGWCPRCCRLAGGQRAAQGVPCAATRLLCPSGSDCRPACRR